MTNHKFTPRTCSEGRNHGDARHSLCDTSIPSSLRLCRATQILPDIPVSSQILRAETRCQVTNFRWMDENSPAPLNEDGNPTKASEGDSSKRLSYQISPPYWQRKRSTTHSTIESSEHTPPITLQDNTEEDAKAHNQLWARSISIDDYVIIQGNSVGIGSYVVWICKVETLDGSPMTIRKRYSEFDVLRSKLLKAFPDSTTKSLPPLPPKSAIYKFKPKFLEKRRQGLAYFLNCVMLSPQYASSIIVKEFIFQNSHV